MKDENKDFTPKITPNSKIIKILLLALAHYSAILNFNITNISTGKSLKIKQFKFTKLKT